MRYPNYLTNYGEALARQVDLRSGLASIDEAIALSEASGQVVGIPEILRIKGNVLRRGSAPQADQASDYYRRSIELARRDGALSWELRSAVSLVEFSRERGGDDEAEAMLALALERFTEGFETGDLRRARALVTDRA
jgi:tetratricopeptide (TPR) repeat protein